jgi:proteasome lid subunit RPN8/RPN11
MSTTIITKVIHEQIRLQAVASYPEECCGLLFGQQTGDCQYVVELREVKNVAESSRQSRYCIAPTDLLDAENFAREHGLEILGVYHSHPNHPARPSELDRERAILHYSYIIASVTRGEAGELTCWTLHDWDLPFDSEELVISDQCEL